MKETAAPVRDALEGLNRGLRDKVRDLAPGERLDDGEVAIAIAVGGHRNFLLQAAMLAELPEVLAFTPPSGSDETPGPANVPRDVIDAIVSRYRGGLELAARCFAWATVQWLNDNHAAKNDLFDLFVACRPDRRVRRSGSSVATDRPDPGGVCPDR